MTTLGDLTGQPQVLLWLAIAAVVGIVAGAAIIMGLRFFRKPPKEVKQRPVQQSITGPTQPVKGPSTPINPKPSPPNPELPKTYDEAKKILDDKLAHGMPKEQYNRVLAQVKAQYGVK